MNNLNKVKQVVSVQNFKNNNRKTMISALKREITCLERQVVRAKIHSSVFDNKTVQTYEEMIDARKSLLYGL